MYSGADTGDAYGRERRDAGVSYAGLHTDSNSGETRRHTDLDTDDGDSATGWTRFKRKLRVASLKALGITSLAFLLSFLLSKPLSFSVSALFSAPEKDEYTIGDFYAGIADRRPVSTLEDRLVIVDIGMAQRDEIAAALEYISLCGPKAVGVDVMFGVPMEGDSTLIAALESVSGMAVLPVTVREDGPGGKFTTGTRPFFYGKVPGIEYAATNLPSTIKGGTIREFATTYPMADGSQLPSFALAVVAMAEPEKAAGLTRRGNRLEIIDYPSRRFNVIPLDQLAERSGELLDKIVLVGSLNDVNDMHAAPINSYLSGVYIHAAAIGTILSGRYYSHTGQVTDWLMACMLCYIVALIGLMVDYRVKGLVNRVLQLALVYTVVQVGYLMYVNEFTIINFAYALMMLTFGLFASDIWIGTQGVIIKTREWRQKRRDRKAALPHTHADNNT